MGGPFRECAAVRAAERPSVIARNANARTHGRSLQDHALLQVPVGLHFGHALLLHDLLYRVV